MDIDRYIIGNSTKMAQLKSILEKIADAKVTTFIFGENGTGKNLVAQTIHDLSSNRLDPFIKVSYSMESGEFLDTELFGTPDGKSNGKLSLAGHGTVALDDIGEWPQTLQVKLLNVLERREFSRKISGTSVPVNCRIVAMNDRDLRLEVKEGIFREDLFYRLNIIPLNIPPLRERPEDIQPLFEHFKKRFGSKAENIVNKVGYDQILQDLLDYSWPGNVRELKDVVSIFFLTGDWGIAKKRFLAEQLKAGQTVIIKSIEFPSEYFQAGISILNYFGTILKEKYPDKRAKIKIAQDGMKVTLIVETSEGDRDIIETAFYEYGEVISGKMPPEEYLTDPLHILALKQKLELTQQELRLTRDLMAYIERDKETRIKNLEDEVKRFYSLIGDVLKHSTENTLAIKDVSIGALQSVSINFIALLNALAAQNERIKSEMSILSEKLNIESPDDNDIKEVKNILSTIYRKEPKTFQDIRSFWEQFGMGVVSSVWATVITDTIRLLCK